MSFNITGNKFLFLVLFFLTGLFLSFTLLTGYVFAPFWIIWQVIVFAKISPGLSSKAIIETNIKLNKVQDLESCIYACTFTNTCVSRYLKYSNQ